MGILFDASNQTFHLQALDTSYVIKIVRSKYLAHLYWGKKIKKYNASDELRFIDRAFSPNPAPATDRTFSLDTLPQEYPAYGNTDFRTPAYQIQLENGSTVTDLRYSSHRIFKGKPKLENLPATYVENDGEAETLEIELIDALMGLKVTLSYSVYEKFNVITRSVRFANGGQEALKLLRVLSMNIDFPDADFDMMQLSGAWGRERHIVRRPLREGIQSVESRRGASSHQHNPFIALVKKNTGEEYGEAYGFSLVYSGNFAAQVEVDQYKIARVSMGINPFDFSWLLEAGQLFQTPEVVMVYSAGGIGEMSRTYHKLYRTRLCRGMFRDRIRPVLLNSWEAVYFQFNADRIEEIAKAGRNLGIELFVLDDGWFGKRNDDCSSLGDWYVNTEKLPGGLKDLADRIRSLGMEFGLWFEPEMVSPDSDLYRAHPDWIIHVPNREPSQGRNQLILDFSRPEVCDAIISMVSAILSTVPITYVKWDMNRHMTEIGSAALPPERQREAAHRYMLGLYRVMEDITSKFPHILFESCSGGGGRFDPGMLYYTPQIWTSDDTDAIERTKIQYGTSIVYPTSSMGAHVSAVPNHQVRRVTPLETRGDVAFSGVLGYELDPTKFTEEEAAAVKQQVSFYKEVRALVQFGEFFRLRIPFEGNETAWMFVSEDKKEALVCYVKVLAEANEPFDYLRLKGLDPDKDYQIIGTDNRYGGDELLHVGLNVPLLQGDFRSIIWRLRAVSG